MSILPNKKQIDSSYILSFFFRNYLKLHNLFVSDEAYAKKRYKRKFGKELDLKNPKTFMEKMQWLKLHNQKLIQTTCADKIAVRDHVKDKIGEEYLIPLERIFSKASEVIPENIPNFSVIIKCSHNSAAYTIVKDKSKIDWKKERVRFYNSLKQNYYEQAREWQYKDISPKILVEKLLVDKYGNIPNDYKLFCFDGVTKFIQVDIGRQENPKRNFYDTNWKLLPLRLNLDNGKDIPKPKSLDLMIELAYKLSEDFSFARVDFYTLNDKVYFGEITFHPGSGFGYYDSNGVLDEQIDSYISLEKFK
ncbi:MAG: glycosyl transferase [Flavobacteriaceae bacterium]|nr:glycosyl transferase [Flavobacteriaceae bacterium]